MTYDEENVMRLLQLRQERAILAGRSLPSMDLDRLTALESEYYIHLRSIRRLSDETA